MHRGSLYKVFGSKRGLYLAALRHHIDQQILPLTAALTGCPDPCQALASAAAAFDSGPAAGLLLLAQAERAPYDPEVAALTTQAFDALDRALEQVLAAGGTTGSTPALAAALGAAVVGLRLRSRTAGAAPTTTTGPDAVIALAARVSPASTNHTTRE